MLDTSSGMLTGIMLPAVVCTKDNRSRQAGQFSVMIWEVTGVGTSSQRKWCFCWALKNEQEVHRHRKGRAAVSWMGEQQERRRREARTVSVVLLVGLMFWSGGRWMRPD